MKIRHYLSASVLGLTAGLLLPAAAAAQDTPAEPAAAPEDAGDSAASDGAVIVVTGSRIARPNLESTVPISTVTGDEFFQTGQTSVGDVLNELPALRSTFSQSNAGRFLGTVGLNMLDLRGLGTQRTLVLVNGRRHVAADILGNAVSPDINTIPSDLIERVDIITGGSSAVYGSDAIAGVVNFILKKDFEGIRLRAQGGVSKYGDAGSYVMAGMVGTNFAEGRGNIVVHGEYAHQNILYGASRPHILQNDAFIQVDSDPAGTPNGSDGIPDRIFFRDIRGATISSSGMFSIVNRVSTPRCGLGLNPGSAQQAYNCNFLVTPDGRTLTPQTGTRAGFGPNGVFIGGNGASNREENLIVLYPNYDRYAVNLLGRFEVSEAFEPFVEAKYVKTRSFGRSSGPAFVQGSSIDANRERIRLDNPFLSPQMRSLLVNEILASGVNPNLATPTTLTAAQIAAINAGTFRVSYRKNFTDLGVRDEDSDRQTFRIVGGARGQFNDDWQYELSVNYGRFREDNKVTGNINVQRFLLALDAGTDPVTGQIRCRSQFDPAAAFGIGGEFADRLLAADIAACVPLNPFGRGDVAAARNYIVQDTVSRSTLSQLVVSGFLSGDSSDWFELPGGPVGFALGGEYRRESLFYQADPLVENGLTFYNALPTFDPAPFVVKEAFGELRLPTLADTPLFRELTINAAGRVADYKGATGTVYSFNLGVDWSPISDLRLRGNFSRAVRAPNLSETAAPLSQNFAPGFQDPCRPANIGGGSATRPANCAAALGPLLPTFDLPAYSLETVSGSNMNLRAERSDSWTIGGVYQPQFAPGLSLSVDYYKITVDDVIIQPTAQQIANACYDAATLDNQFCDLFERHLGPGQGPNDEDPGQIIDGTLDQVPLNYAALRARGIDVELGYRRDIEGFGMLSGRLVYTHVLQLDQFFNPADPTFANRVLSELGDPQDAFNIDLGWTSGPLTLGYQLRYLSKMVLNQYEDFFSVQGRPPQDADWADRQFYPSVVYHDVRLGFDVNKQFNFYMGIDNFTNRKPPLGATGIGAGSGIYDVRGRFFYAGAVAKF